MVQMFCMYSIGIKKTFPHLKIDHYPIYYTEWRGHLQCIMPYVCFSWVYRLFISDWTGAVWWKIRNTKLTSSDITQVLTLQLLLDITTDVYHRHVGCKCFSCLLLHMRFSWVYYGLGQAYIIYICGHVTNYIAFVFDVVGVTSCEHICLFFSMLCSFSSFTDLC